MSVKWKIINQFLSIIFLQRRTTDYLRDLTGGVYSLKGFILDTVISVKYFLEEGRLKPDGS